MKNLFIMVLATILAPVAIAKTQVSPTAVEMKNTIRCQNGGCTLVCKGPSGSAYKREQKIDSAEVIVLGSGTVMYHLAKFGETVQVAIPPGTESCQLKNIR